MPKLGMNDDYDHVVLFPDSACRTVKSNVAYSNTLNGIRDQLTKETPKVISRDISLR